MNSKNPTAKVSVLVGRKRECDCLSCDAADEGRSSEVAESMLETSTAESPYFRKCLELVHSWQCAPIKHILFFALGESCRVCTSWPSCCG